MGYDLTTQCLECGECLAQCPFFAGMEFRGLGATDLISNIINFIEGAESSEAVYRTIWSCAGCAWCQSVCPTGIAPSLFSTARRESIRRGQPAPALAQQLLPGPDSFASVLAALQITPHQARWYTSTPIKIEHADCVVFLGCYIMAIPHLIFTLLDILDQIGVNYAAVGGGNLCCGASYSINGDTEGATRASVEALKTIMAFTPQTVIFDCASCQNLLQSKLPESVNCRHYTSFLLENLPRIKYKRSPDKVITYHDSCDPRRGMGDYETPRHLLGSIPGITLVEMEHNRHDSLCCGGLANSTFPDVTRRTRKRRLEEARNSGAELVVTSCRSCFGALVGLDSGYPVVASDIVLLGEAMGIHHKDTFREILYQRDMAEVIRSADMSIRAWGLDPVRIGHLAHDYLAGKRDADIPQAYFQ